MKKSCSGKESKVVTTKNADGVLREDPKEQLTEEQLYINKQLSDSGIDCEGLGWLEKRNIVKTINVSLDSAGSESLQRSSPRLASFNNSRAKWVENSFENTNKEDTNNGRNSKTRSRKKKSKKQKTASKKEAEDITQKSGAKKDNSSEKFDQGSINCDSPKSSRKVHYIKIQVEGKSEEECNNTSEGLNSGAADQGSGVRKKRASDLNKNSVDSTKKIKMEETNNGVLPEEEENSLRVEVEIEKIKENTPFVPRDVKLIVSECDNRNIRWKETFSKYHWPTRWGIPIVRNCSEKWDGKHIPQKLLHRYQKYLSSNNLFHSAFFPVDSPNSGDFNKLSSDISFQLSTCNKSECRDQSEQDLKDMREDSFINEESKNIENNLNASTSGGDTTGRMVLRNRGQQKPIVLEEDEYSSDDSDEWYTKQKQNKKQKINSKNKRAGDQNSKQLALKLENCNINKRNGNEGGRKNGNKNEVSFTGGSLLSNNAMSNSKVGPDPDTVVCPICSIRFKKQLIVGHATECASKTYKD